jgi:hypothetical protein
MYLVYRISSTRIESFTKVLSSVIEVFFSCDITATQGVTCVTVDSGDADDLVGLKSHSTTVEVLGLVEIRKRLQTEDMRRGERGSGRGKGRNGRTALPTPTVPKTTFIIAI